jgi:PAS domain S-box-containing protein
MVSSFVYELGFVVVIILIFVLIYLIRSSTFKKVTNKRLKTLFEISKQFYRNKSLRVISDQSLKVLVDSLSEITFAGLVLCEDDRFDYTQFYDEFRGYKEVKLSSVFINKLKDSKIYFSINQEQRMLNYPGLDKSSRKYDYFHVLKFYLDKNSYGAFIIGSPTPRLENYDYEFLRIFVEHFAFGVRTRYLTTKVRHFSKTIDVLENTYQRIVDNLPVGVVGIENSEDNKILLWNDLMEEMTELDSASIIEKPIHEVFGTKENQQLISKLVAKTMLSKEIEEISCLNYKTKSGKKKNFLILCYLLRDYESGFDGSILVFKDITENIELEDQLRRSQEMREDDLKTKIQAATKELKDANVELKQLNSMKSEFVSVVSHELRTPLTSIRGYASLLISERLGKLTEQQKNSIDVIAKEGERLSDLINDLLDLSKLQAGKINIKLENKNIYETVKDSLNSLMIQAEIKHIDLKLTGLDKLFIYHDPEKMKRVLYNIVGNAIKFTPEKGKVTVKIKETNDYGEIDVVDTGVGIPQEQLETIFQPFSQVETSLKRQSSGTGLGLTISQHIMELHHGIIEVKSQIDKGSTFKIKIPKALCVLESGAIGEKPRRKRRRRKDEKQ